MLFRSATDAIERVEVIAGAGSLMYGTDALAGTVNIITNEPNFTPARRLTYGFNGFYSTNEHGWRGSVNVGATAPRYAFRVQGGARLSGSVPISGAKNAALKMFAAAVLTSDPRFRRIPREAAAEE